MDFQQVESQEDLHGTITKSMDMELTLETVGSPKEICSQVTSQTAKLEVPKEDKQSKMLVLSLPFQWH